MPLSDHEQRLLQQMEQAMNAEDPKFAESLRKQRNVQMDKGRFALGVGGVILGMLILVAGVAITQPVVGMLGFLAMVASAFVGYRAWNGSSGSTPAEEDSDPKSPPLAAPMHDDSFMNKMEERWRKRRDQGPDTR